MFLSKFRCVKLGFFTQLLAKRLCIAAKPASYIIKSEKAYKSEKTVTKNRPVNEEVKEPADQGINEIKNIVIHRELLRKEFDVFETRNVVKKNIQFYEKFLQIFNESYSFTSLSKPDKINIKFQDLCVKLNSLSEKLKLLFTDMVDSKSKLNNDVLICLNLMLQLLLKEKTVLYNNGKLSFSKFIDPQKMASLSVISEIFEGIELSNTNEIDLKKFFYLFNSYADFIDFNLNIYEKIESFIEDKLKDIDFEDPLVSNIFLTCLLRNKKHFPKFSHIFFNHKDVFLKGKTISEMAVIFNEVFSSTAECLKNLSNNDLNIVFNMFLEEVTNKKVLANEEANYFLFYLHLLKKIKHNDINFSIQSSVKNNLINSLLNKILSTKFNYKTPRTLDIILELSQYIPKEKNFEYLNLLQDILKNQSNPKNALKVTDYFGFNYNENVKYLINQITRELNLNSSDCKSALELIVLLYSLAVYNSKNYSKILSQVEPLLDKKNLNDIYLVSCLLFSNTKMLMVNDFDSYEFYLRFLLLYKEDTFKDPQMIDLFPKMIWTISNFILNTNDCNPVFKDMLRQFKERIHTLVNPYPEDVDYILQTVYFLGLMIKKNMITMYSSVEEIIPRKEINRFLMLKKELMEQNILYQKDLKIVGDKLLENRLLIQPSMIVDDYILDYTFPNINKVGLIIVNDSHYLKEDKLNYNTLFTMKYYKEKKYNIYVINADQVKRNNKEEIAKLTNERLTSEKSSLFKL